MKRYLILLVGLLLFYTSFFSATVSADDSITVRVGIYENSPKIFTDDKGNASGFWPDIIEYIASKEGWKIEYVHGTWTECLTRLENTEIDIMPDVAYSEERSALDDFSNEIVYVSWSRVYTREGVDIQSLLDLEGKNVAVLKGSVNVEGPDGIKALVSAFHVNCSFIEVDSYIKVFELIQNGEADAGVTSKDFGYQHEKEYNVLETAIIFQPASLYFAFSKNSSLTPYLIERVDYHVKELKEDQGSIYYQSLDKWLGVKPVGESVIPGWTIWTLIGIGGLAFLLAGGSVILRSQVKSKTKKLTAEIIEHKQAKDALKESDEKLRSIVENSSDQIFMLDKNCKFLSINKAAANLSRKSPNEMIGKSLFEIFPETIAAQFSKNIKNVFDTGKSIFIDEKMVMQDREFYNSTALNPVKDGSGRVIAVAGIVRDITERKVAEEKIKKQNIQLKKLDGVKTDFLNTTSHELRTPVSSIKGYIQMLLKHTLGDITEEQKKALEVILRNTNRLDHLIQDILDISRLESGVMKFITEKTDVTKMVNEIVETMQASADLKRIKIKIDIQKGIPDLMIDSERIKQVLLNLVDNAIKFSPDGSTINVKTRKEKEDVLFEVQDFGRGIPKNKQKKIFEKFYQVDSGIDRKFGGVGLGLTISKKIINLFGGQIWVDSTLGKGSSFKFTLPLE